MIAGCYRTLWRVALVAMLALIASPAPQDISINFGQGAGLTERVIQLVALITVLSLRRPSS